MHAVWLVERSIVHYVTDDVAMQRKKHGRSRCETGFVKRKSAVYAVVGRYIAEYDSYCAESVERLLSATDIRR